MNIVPTGTGAGAGAWRQWKLPRPTGQHYEERMCDGKAVKMEEKSDVCIVERLFSSSLVAIVSLKAPRKLKVCHFKKGTEICNYSYSNTILAVKLNRQVSGTKPLR